MRFLNLHRKQNFDISYKIVNFVPLNYQDIT
jgi:hypothetical protein